MINDQRQNGSYYNHANSDVAIPTTASSTGSPSSVDATKNPADQDVAKHKPLWRKLLDPDFYPEITVTRALFFFIWIMGHVIVMIYFGVKFKDSPLSRRTDISFRHLILLDMAMILIFMSPTFILLLRRTFLPRFITFEKNIHAHKVAAYTLIIVSAFHIGIYYHRYIVQTSPFIDKKGKLSEGIPLRVNLFEEKSGWTGHVLLFSYFLIIVTSIIIVRKRCFELFYYTHHLFLVTIVMLYMHHKNEIAYKYLNFSVAIYGLDRVYRAVRSLFARSHIKAVVQHPSGVVEVQLDKKIFKPRVGQYVKVYCPSVSLFQWHPITISSSPEEDIITLHFRVEGGWTRRLAERLGCDFGDDHRQSLRQGVTIKVDDASAFRFKPNDLKRIPYHPLHHDPTAVPLYSQAGINSSYLNINIASVNNITRSSIVNTSGPIISGDDPANYSDKTIDAISKAGIDDEKNTALVRIRSAAQSEKISVQVKGGRELPILYIDGPYSAPSEHFFDYEIGVLISAGIGVTPAASVLRSVYFQKLKNKELSKTKKVYMFWAYRDIDTLEWFKDLLLALDEEGLGSIVEVHTYYTGPLSGDITPQLVASDNGFGTRTIDNSMGKKTFVGRPDFDQIYESLGVRHPGSTIGAFFCGPKPMARKVRKITHKWDRALRKQNNTKIDFSAESF